jgi:hypothetical protein
VGTGPRAAGDVAVLGGTVHEPCFELRFGRDDTHLTTGQALTQWVKERPDRRWDPDNRYGKCWVVTGFGSRPGQDLAAAGFGDYVVDIEAPEGTDLSLASLTRPKAVLSDRAGYATVFPRLLGYLLSRTLLGGTARWIPGGARRFEVPLSSFPIEGVDTDPAVLIAAAEHTARRVELDEHAGDVALSIGLEAAGQAGVELANLVGSVPDWFGLELDDYQLAGALAVAAGHALLADEPGLGKGSPSWVKILTPTGWTTYGDVQVGDQVVGSDGRPTSVIGVYPRGQLDVFTVTMSDGSSVVVDGDHLWSVQTKNQRFKDDFARTLSTREIMEQDLCRSYGGVKENMNFIPMVKPVEFEHSGRRPLDPYLLGVLLGDGSFASSASVSLTSGDPEVFTLAAERCPEGVSVNQWRRPEDKPPTAGLSGPGGGRPNPVTAYLREVGLMGRHSHEKFVPEAYLFAPVEDRVELLRGLMDTDGTAGVAASFSSTSPMLAEAVEFLVRSLGGVTHTATKKPWYIDRHGDKKRGRLAYNVCVTLDPEICPFRIKRKVDAWVRPWKYRPLRTIRSIEPAGRADVTCIAVDADDCLYVTEDFIVTHNTRQFLAAAAMLRSKRTVIMCPPVVVTAWERETLASGLADDHHGLLEPYLAALAAEEQGAEPAGPGGAPPTSPRPAGSDAPTSLVDRGPHGATANKKPAKKRKPKGPVPGTPGWNIVTFRSGRKEPDLPPYGVVIVPDTLVAGRPELAKRLAAWAPDVVGSDEAHRAKTWMSTRSKAIRDLAAAARIQGVAITGTPLFAKCLELAGPLAVAGLLDPVFGGYYKFREDFCRKDNFNQWVTRKSKLPELKRLLDKHCWVLRFKTDVLKDLPPKRRQASLIDVDLAGFRSAHDDVVEEIDEWLRTFIADEGRDPEFKEMKAWAKSQVSMMTRLRVAAGLAKIPTIVEKIGQWIETHPETDGVYDRPLIVWAHHGDVAEALVAAVTDKGQKASSILGSTSHNTRSRVVDEYQAGTVPVLVASIHAAGVGITLTRGCDAWFAEADPTPAIISQAECRQDRRGQTRPVTCTTFIAPGTFDERIQAILNTKSEELDVLMPGADDNVAVLDTKEIREPWEIIVELTQARLARQFTRKKRQAA